ncbi:MAG TPA: ribbon-helix-helix protein, CopG family [Solirubrobacteraceae bacterium]|nr:ribbon-helix-helix protein, CopG family [Solirubrobacteraceae bacterium]
MPRTQTLVQLSAELVALLDQRAVHERRSRSDLIREAIEQYMDTDRQTQISRQIVAGYGRVPQCDDGLERWARRAASDLLAQESW